MSEETTKNEINDDGLDDLDLDLGMDDFDIDVEPGKDDRNTVTKLSSGFAQGVKDDLVDPNKVAGRLKKVMPKSYETSFETLDKTAGLAGGLYNTAMQETKQGVKDFKKASSKLLKSKEGVLPDWVTKKLGPLLEVDETRDISAEEARDSSIASDMASIFETSMQQLQGNAESEEARQITATLLDNKRHEGQIEQLFAIRQSVHRLVTYQDRVTARYQKKSLELKYRQLFVSKDIHQVISESSKDVKEALGAVVKNTALPDYQKIELTEASGQAFRDAVLGNVQGKAVDFFSNFTKNITSNLTEKVRGKAKQVGEGLSGIAGQMEQSAEMGEMGIDTTALAGSVAGSAAVDFAANKLSPKAREYLEKYPSLLKMGLKLNTFVENLPANLNKFSKTDTEDNMFAGVINAIKEAMPTMSQDSNLAYTGVGDSLKPAIFDTLTRKSIIEIIPGYLSRIHHELVTVRSGMGFDPDPTKRVRYNNYKSTFNESGDITKDVREYAISDEKLFAGSREINELILSIDPDNRLSSDAKNALAKRILKDMFNGDGFDITSFVDPAKKDDSVSSKTFKEISNLIKERFGIDESINEETGKSSFTIKDDLSTLTNLNTATKKTNKLLTTLEDPKAKIEAMLELGSASDLEELGLITRDKKGNPKFNYDKLFDSYIDGSFDGTVNPLQAEFDKGDYSYNTTAEQADLDATKASSVVRPSGFVDSLKAKVSAKYSGTEDNFVGPRQPSSLKGNVTAVFNKARATTESFINDKDYRDEKLGVGKQTAQGLVDTMRTKGSAALESTRNAMSASPMLTKAEATVKAELLIRKLDPLGKLTTAGKKALREILVLDFSTGGNPTETDPYDSRYLGDELPMPVFENILKTIQESQALRESGKLESNNPLSNIRGTFKSKYDSLSGKYNVDEVVGNVSSKASAIYNDLSKEYNEGTLLDSTKQKASGWTDNAREHLGTNYEGSSLEEHVTSLASKARSIKKDLTDKATNVVLNEHGDANRGFGFFKKMYDSGKVTPIEGESLTDRLQKQAKGYGQVLTEGYNGLKTNLVSKIDTADITTPSVLKDAVTMVGDQIAKITKGNLALEPEIQPDTTTESLNEKSDNTLSSILGEVRDSLNGSAEGIGTDIKSLKDKLTPHEKDPQEAQIALLTGILENVNAISQIMAKGDKESWLSVKGISKKTGRLMSKVGSSFGNFYLGGLRMFGGGFSGVGSILKGGGKAIGGGLGKLFGKKHKLGAVDVYLKGTEEPIMEGSKFTKGQYFDSESGKVIKTVEELRNLQGDVIEYVDGQPRIVATTTTLSEGIYDRFGKSLGGKGLLGGLKGLGSGLTSYITAPSRMLIGGAKKLGRGLKTLANKQVDVYVKGETTPRILATVMRNSGYISAVTKLPIKDISKIDGDILDRQGNVVLSLSEAAEGLVDKNGRPLKFFTRQLDRVKSLLSITARGIGKVGSSISGAGGKAVRGIRGLVTKGVDKVKGTELPELSGLKELEMPLLASNKKLDKQISVLKEIRELLDERLEKKNPLDTDGDGFRQGSWREKLYSKDKDTQKEAVSKKATSKLTKIPGAGTALSLMGMGGKGDSEGTDDGWDMGDSALGAGAMWAAGKLKGGLGKLKGLFGGAKAATTVAGVGKAASKASIASRVLPMAGKILPMLGTATTAVGSAIGTVVASPVLLTAAVLSGVAVGGYFLYKHLTKITVGDFTKIRLMQYGIDPEDKDSRNKIFYIEDQLSKITKAKGIEISIKLKDLKMIELLEDLGIDPEDRIMTADFATWFKGRFLPVYKANYTGIKFVTGKMELADVDDDLVDSDKLAYLEWMKRATQFTEAGRGHPYAVLVPPFSKSITVKESDIQGKFTELTLKINSLDIKDKKDKDSKTKPLDEVKKKRAEQQELHQKDIKQYNKPIDKLNNNKTDNPVAIQSPTDSGSSSRNKGNGNSETYAKQQNNRSQLSGQFGMGRPIAHPGKGLGGDINDLPLPSSGKGWDSHKDLIVSASNMVDVDPGLMATMAAIESGFNSNAKARTSSASGLYQFINSTWKRMLYLHGDKYGISPTTSQFDPRANALMGAEFLKGNVKKLSKVLKRDITDTDVYLAHFLGAGGASKFLTSDPNENAATVMPMAAKANTSIFYGKNGARTMGDVYKVMDNKVSRFSDIYSAEARALGGILAKAPPVQNTVVDMASIPEPKLDSPVISVKQPTIKERIARGSITTTTPKVTAPNEFRSEPKPTPISASGLMKASASMTSPQSTTHTQNDSLRIASERRVRELQVSRLKDLQGKEVSVNMSNDISRMVELMSDSLRTQMSMDNSLTNIANTISLNNSSDPTKEIDTNTKPAVVKRRPRDSGNSKEMQDSIVNLKRNRVI